MSIGTRTPRKLVLVAQLLILALVGGTCDAGDVPAVAPVSRSPLPPREVVTVDVPTASADGAWTHWPTGGWPIYDMSLDGEERVLWLATEGGLVRWDLDTLTGSLLTELDGVPTGSVSGVLVESAGPVWAVLNGEGFWHESTYGGAYANWLAVYDDGEWRALPRPAFRRLRAMGMDGQGALWLISGSGYGVRPYRCTGYPDDWNCVYFDVVPEPVSERFRRCRRYTLRPPNWRALWECVTQSRKGGRPLKALLQECARRGRLLSVTRFWNCMGRPRERSISLEPPARADWRAYSDSAYCFDRGGWTWSCGASRSEGTEGALGWERDGAGRLVLVAPGAAAAARTLPWPGGVEEGGVRVTHGSENVWLFGERLCVFEMRRWRCFEWPYPRPSDWIADSRRGGVWALVPGLGLLYVDVDDVRLYIPGDRLWNWPVRRDFEPHRLMPPGRGVAATTLAQTRDGRVWVGTDGAGLWVYDGRGERWRSTDLTQDFVDALWADASGGLWIGTRFAGLVHYDGRDTWRRWRVADGLPSDTVTSLAGDSRGRLWVGTADDGLALFDGQTWRRFDTAATVGEGHITGIVVDADDRVFFGYHGGVGRYDGAAWEGLPYVGRADGWPVAMALDDGGRLWTANYLEYGLDLYTPAGVRIVCRQGIEVGSRVYSVTHPRALWFDETDGSLWVGGYSVLFQVDGRSEACRYADRPQPPLGPILAVLKDRRGRVWAAGYRGVSMYHPSGDAGAGGTGGQPVPSKALSAEGR